MDPHFDPTKSSSSSILKCTKDKSGKCFFSQSYSEGSSWHAFKVTDKLWLGGPNASSIKSASDLTVKFEFGCQDSETGLFRTQNIDGIMGFSGQANTLPYKMMEQKITSTKMFSMCFRIGGGFMTIGGMDTTIHDRKSPTSTEPVDIKWAKLQKPNGWFTVKILDVLLTNPTEGGVKSIGGAAFKYNSGKGAIVDSGTTDTYLPSSLASNFKEAFKTVTGGMMHTNTAVSLTEDKFKKLPTIVYRLESASG
jgi:hypothetical protein